MIAIGHLVGYGIGTVNLPKVLGNVLGDTQFKQLTAISALALILAVSVTSYAVDERILISASYLGWFPFLFYGSTWVGETYFRYSAPESAKQPSDAVGDIGRIGSLSLIVFSTVTFTGSIILPWVVNSPENEKHEFTPRPPPSLAKFIKVMNGLKPDLLTAWMLSHLIFAGAMCLTPFVRSLHFATVLISICGMYVLVSDVSSFLPAPLLLSSLTNIFCRLRPWAFACWAPFAFIGIEINRLTSSPLSPPHSASATYTPLLSTHVIDVDSPPSSPTRLRLNHLERDIDSAASSSTGETAGIYLGILNLFATLPQFLGTFISMLVFAILEPGRKGEGLGQGGEGAGAGGGAGGGLVKQDGVNAISVCLFIGAMSSLGAACATWRFGCVR
ncbi:MAG: hypothetical protein Q9187_003344 [Circinaria calcarea]